MTNIKDNPRFNELKTTGIRRLEDIYNTSEFSIRFVGGCVRDIMRDRPFKDIDLATDAMPNESIQLLVANNVYIVGVTPHLKDGSFDHIDLNGIPGYSHGTITAVVNHEQIEITTLRVDVNPDGRHSDVAFTRSWELDAERRDLTFNAMSLDMDGNLYDYHGGLDDLNKGVARFVGDAAQRIKDDTLRILRYFRFQGTMDNPKFLTTTLQTIQDHAHLMSNLSGERIWSEMKRIVTSKHAERLIVAMIACRVTDVVGLHKVHSIFSLTKLSSYNDHLVSMASILPDVDAVDYLTVRWKLSVIESNKLAFLVNNRDNKLTLDAAKDMVAYGANRDWVKDLLVLQHRPFVDEFNNWAVVPFPVRGQDLLNHGIKPGPVVGRVLKALRDSWVNSRFTKSRDDLLKEVF